MAVKDLNGKQGIWEKYDVKVLAQLLAKTIYSNYIYEELT